MSRIRVALVGTGGIAARHHVPAIRELADDLELVAVADVDRDRAEDAARRWGVPAAYGSTAELLERERPDLVDVCTPPGSHAGLSVDALRAGAWVWCEKPPCSSLAELDAVAAAERETGRRCAFVFQWRFGAGARHLRHHVELGTFGRPLVAICQTTWYRDAAYYAVPWRGRWDTEAGGPTVGHGIHNIDLMLWLLGGWREVRAMVGRLDRAVQTEDVSLAMVELESGARASVVTSVLSPREESYLRLDFQRATVEVRHLYGYSNGDWLLTPVPGDGEAELRERWGRFPDAAPAGHTAQLRSLVEDLRRDREPVTSPAGVRPTMELLAALYRSALTGAPVRRGEIGPADPFYHAFHGSVPGWAP